MFDFIRSDLSNLNAYTAHLGGTKSPPQGSLAPTNIDRVNTNESPYDLPLEIKAELAKFYQDRLESNRYPDGDHGELKTAIAEYINEYPHLKQPIASEHISIGNGSDELIRSLLIATCLNQEGAILCANPTFSMYSILATTLGIPCVEIGRSPDRFEMDLEAARQALSTTQNPPIRVIFVLHPNSPTGNILTEGEIEWLKNIPDNILVVIDEAYFEFSQTSLVTELLEHPNWVILRTFSKAFRLASMRIGYAIAHPQLIAILEKIRLPYNLTSFSLAAAQFILERRQLLLSSVPQLLKERDRLFNELAQMPHLKVWPSDGNFIYLSSTRSELEDKGLRSLALQLKDRGTLVRYTGGGLRITVGTPGENQHTLERMHEIVTGNW